MIFVDTGGWFASIVPTDKNHDKARNWFLQNREPLITTNYVVDETLTLLRRVANMPVLYKSANDFLTALCQVSMI